MSTKIKYDQGLLAFKSVHIQCLDEDNIIINGAYGSGFICKEDGTNFLYTSWHLVTGYQMYNLKIKEPPKGRFLRISLQNSQLRQPGVEVMGGNQIIDIPLYNKGNIPSWFQDKKDIPNIFLNNINIRVPFWHDVIKIQLPDDVIVSKIQSIDKVDLFHGSATIGDRLFIVGYPYGYSSLGMEQPTPIVLTRYIASKRIEGRQREILLDGAGAPGMSGGPVFIETESGIFLFGIYTGLIYPDNVIGKNENSTLLGTCCELNLCWNGLPLEN